MISHVVDILVDFDGDNIRKTAYLKKEEKFYAEINNGISSALLPGDGSCLQI